MKNVMTIVMLVAVLTVILLTGSSAWAATLPFSDNFNTGTNGETLDSPWYSNATGGFRYDDVAIEGSRSAKADPGASREAIVDITTDKTTIEWTWWYMSYSSLSSNTRAMSASLEDTANNKIGPYLKFIKGATDKYVNYYNGSSWIDLGAAWNEATWYEIKVVLTIDPNDTSKNDTFDFSMRTSGGTWTQYGNDCPTYEDIDDIDQVWYSNTSSGHTHRGGYYIDDVRIVPEPATMSLLLLGLPFALRRRR